MGGMRNGHGHDEGQDVRRHTECLRRNSHTPNQGRFG